jgi:hypothetical protein
VSTSEAATIATPPTVTAAPEPSSTLVPASTLVPVDPTVLILIALGNASPADADELVSSTTATRAIPCDPADVARDADGRARPDVRLLGSNAPWGSLTTATFLTGPIDPEAVLANLQAALAPSPTYTVTPPTDGGHDHHPRLRRPADDRPRRPAGMDGRGQRRDQLGIVRIKRRTTPSTRSCLSPICRPSCNPKCSTGRDRGQRRRCPVEHLIRLRVESLGDSGAHCTRPTYDIASDFPTATAKLTALLTSGWERSDQEDALTFTSTTTSEVWTLDELGGTTHLTYDTGS